MAEYPTLEEVMIRQAVKKLTEKQQLIWELYNYDRLTQDEMAEKLGVSRETVKSHVRSIERKIRRFCDEHKTVYAFLKEEIKREKKR